MRAGWLAGGRNKLIWNQEVPYSATQFFWLGYIGAKRWASLGWNFELYTVASVVAVIDVLLISVGIRMMKR
ncbi:hypothetical protein DPMN_076470 [Dreissena polymorpha]|uniref:Uncharacterized protein n=1 Tax=Dreissena polymorpha TaxID=45954 RepID=A0A9D3YK58_DREPO|nr:hypothetical protein DPMN_076470 [Dreissena polymorpha]